MSSQEALSSENLAYWFLRLNGFFTIENFILHPEIDDFEIPTRSPSMRSDADIVGVRFPFRNEQGMRDFESFMQCKSPMLLILEVTAGEFCKVNGPWSKPERRNVHRFLSALGLFAPDVIDSTASELYRHCFFQNEALCVQYATLAHQPAPMLRVRFPRLLQLTWTDVLKFIHGRLNEYRLQKADRKTWREDGHRLWQHSSRSEQRFVREYLEALVLEAASAR